MMKLNLQNDKEKFIAVLKYYNIFQQLDKYKIVCPFHADKNASMQINIDKAYFFCYGCEVHGGAQELAKQFYILKHKKEPKTLEIMQFLAKISKSENSNSDIYNIYNINIYKANDKQEKLKAREYYYNLPQVNWLCPKRSSSVYEEALECRTYLNQRGFKNSFLVKCGAKATLNSSYPVIFPLLENKIFRGYVCRTFDKEIEEKRKYLYNRGFCRQKTLAGTYTKNESLVVVEGYIDCLKAQQFGVKNVVALLGWKISDYQLEKIKKSKIPKIICALDNDEAGNKGAEYLKSICKRNKIEFVRIKYPKHIKDFGDLKENSKELRFVIQKINKFFVYK